MVSEKPVLIMAAVAMELRPLRKQLPLIEKIPCPRPLKLEIRKGPKGPIYLALTGMGPQMATQSVHQLFSLVDPGQILSVGLAGALQENLGVGSLILANRCYELCNEENLILSDHAFDIRNMRTKPEFTIGALVSSPKIITKSKTKKRLGCENGYNLVGVEMETYSILRVIRDSAWKTVPFFSLRAISDTVNQDLNIDFSQMINARGQMKPLQSLSYFLRQPQATARLTALLHNSKIATQRMTEAILELLQA